MSETAAIHLSELTSKPLAWLWEGRIPLGKLTLLDGDPGVGKTLLALHLAARVSKGTPMPLAKGSSAFPEEPANILLNIADDTLSDTVIPRLEAASADLSRFWAIDREINADDIARYQPKLIIIDPLSSYLGGREEQPNRHTIQSLTRLARESGAAILAIQDLPEEETENERWYVEIQAAARVVLVVTALDQTLRRLAVEKTNLRSLSEARPLVYRHDSDGESIKIANWSDHL